MGFPRSGTTLIEQVLASHSAVRAGGELSFVTELRQFSLQQFAGPEPFPENLARTWTADNRWAATLFRDYYFARAEQYGLLAPGKRYFTDKMPFNEIWLPLVRMAFPHAKIVRVLRHPLDVCVSMLANNMTHGFNCGYRIEDIVHHLLAVSDLDEHYARELAADAAPAALRALRRGTTRRDRTAARSSWARARAGVPELPREPALRADSELCAGDSAAQRPFHRTSPALRARSLRRCCRSCSR